MSSAKGFQTVWFGVLPLPDLLRQDKALGNLLETGAFRPELHAGRRAASGHVRQPALKQCRLHRPVTAC